MADSLFGKILIANDGSEGARKALAAAIELAQRYESELHVITVEEHLPQHQGSIIGGELRTKTRVADHLRLITIQKGGDREVGTRHSEDRLPCRPCLLSGRLFRVRGCPGGGARIAKVLRLKGQRLGVARFGGLGSGRSAV